MLKLAQPQPIVPYELSGERGDYHTVVQTVTFLVASAAGYVWGRIDAHISWFIITGAASILLGCALGIFCVWLAQKMKCRCAPLVAETAMIGGMLAVYYMAAGYLTEVIAISGTLPEDFLPMQLLIEPPLLLRVLTSVKGANWYIWLFEAATIVSGSMICAKSIFARQIYCEHCHIWLDIKKNSLRYLPPRRSNLELRLLCGDLRVFAKKTTVSRIRSSDFVRIDYVKCKTCRKTGVYQISEVLPTGAESAKPEERALTPLLRLTRRDNKRLKLLLRRDKKANLMRSGKKTARKKRNVLKPTTLRRRSIPKPRGY